MKNSVLILVLVTALASTACIKSLQSFYEAKNLYFDKTLAGTWVAADGKETWTVVAEDEAYYVIDQTDEEGRKSRFEARLFRIGDDSFLDLVAVPAGDYINTDRFFDHSVPIHSLIAIKKDRCSSRMYYLDPSWLKSFLAQNPKAVGHADVDGMLVLTDSTKNIQSFIKKHLRTSGAFEETETLFKQGDKQCGQNNL